MAGPLHRGQQHRFVPLALLSDHLLLGWVPHASLEGTFHGEYSVHMTNLEVCACGRAPPRPVSAHSGPLVRPKGKGPG